MRKGVFMTAALAGLPLMVAAVAPSAMAMIRIVAPRDGAVLGAAEVYLSGTEDGRRSGSVQITVNGRALPAVALRSGAFSALLSLRPGKNRISVNSGGSSRELTLEHRPGGGTYNFHPGYLEGECSECHEAGPGRTVWERHSDLCYSCHDRKDTVRFLHGPVGAGLCMFCHDPHGSPRSRFLKAAVRELCVGCHDQPSSMNHLNSSSRRSCLQCHNPHGSQKKFFLLQ